MNLRNFLYRDGRVEATRLALIVKVSGKSAVSVLAYANGARRVPAKLDLMQKIEQATSWSVTRYDLRPDVYGSSMPRGFISAERRRAHAASLASS